MQPQATVCGEGKSNHREVFAGQGAIKLKRSQDWRDMKLCFSGPSKLDHYCMAYPNLGSCQLRVSTTHDVLNTFEHQKIVALVDICED